MKLLGSTLAVTALVCGTANAELFKGLRAGGQFDLQATSARNVTDFTTHGTAATPFNDRIGDAQTRVMLHIGWDVLDDVHTMVTLRKNDRTWGTNGGAAVGATNSQTLQANAADNVLGNIWVDQAYIKIDKLMGAVDATLGRQFYGESGDMVIYFGPSDKAQYGLPVTALDTARFDWSNDMIGLTGIVGKMVGHNLGTAGAVADQDIQGLNAMLKGHDNLSAGGYAYRAVIHNVGALGTPPNTVANEGGVNSYLYIVGLKAKAMLGSAAWLGGEVAKNFGSERNTQETATQAGSRNFTGWAAKVDAGMKAEVAGLGGLMPWAHGAIGSGDENSTRSNDNGFQAINGDYRPGTIYGRFSNGNVGDIGSGLPTTGVLTNNNNTLTNRVIWGVGVKVMPGMWQKLTIGASYWDFRTQTSATPTTGARPFSGNKHLGSEADLDLMWKHSDNVGLGAGVAEFFPGGIIKNDIAAAGNRGDNPAQLAYFDVRVKWGGQ